MLRLYDFSGSPFCIKIRALLDYKQLPYERIDVVGPKNLELRRRGKIGKVPALEIDYYRWIEDQGRRAAASIFPPPLGWVLGQVVGRRARMQVTAQGVGRKSPQHVLRDLRRHLAKLDALLLPGPYLLGREPMICDFSVMGQLVYVIRTPVGAEEIARHPGIGKYLERMRALRAGKASAA